MSQLPLARAPEAKFPVALANAAASGEPGDCSESPCPVQASCGGCPRLHLSSAAQRVHKLRALQQCFVKNSLEFSEPEWLSDGRAVGYRNRIRLRLEQGRPAFFNPEKVDHCAVLRPELLATLAEVRHWAEQRCNTLAHFHHLEVRVPDLDGNAGLSLHFAPHRVAPILAEGQNVFDANELALSAPDGCLLALPDALPPFQRFAVTGSVYVRCAVTSFMQVNSGVNALLVQTVLAIAQESGARNMLDLFAGNGNFSLPLAAAGYDVTALELDARAIQGQRLAAQEQGLKLSTECQDLRVPFLEHLRPTDLVVANPPRAGLGALTPQVASLAGKHLILCCCSAESFTRDAAMLVRSGFQLARWFAIDMFPGTDHVEVLGHFRR